MHWNISQYPILSSTNDLVMERMRDGRAQAGDVVAAAEQLAGRGRPGRVWHSNPGALAMTVVLPLYPELAGWCSLTAGVAAVSALRALKVPAGLKWPNDLQLAGLKLGGILVESSDPALIAVGIGINVSNRPPNDPEVAARAGFAADYVPDLTPDRVLHEVLDALDHFWSQLGEGRLDEIRARWEEWDTTRGRRIRWSRSGECGAAEGVNSAGGLVIRMDDGSFQVATVGEVQFL